MTFFCASLYFSAQGRTSCDFSTNSEFANRSSKRNHGSLRHGAMTMVKNGDQLDLGCHSGNARAIRAQHSANTQAKITKMLLLVSTVFVILNLPSYVSRLWVFIKVSACKYTVLL
jgi:hypothetical protein